MTGLAKDKPIGRTDCGKLEQIGKRTVSGGANLTLQHLSLLSDVRHIRLVIDSELTERDDLLNTHLHTKFQLWKGGR